MKRFFAVLFLCLAGLAGCGDSPNNGVSQPEKPVGDNKQRFEVHRQDINGPTFYRVHDKQNGKDYLLSANGGWLEIEPTNKSLPFDK